MKNNPTNLFSVKNKVFIITGGSGFLGQVYVKTLKKLGAHVVVWDRIGAKGVDITNESDIKSQIKEIVKIYKKIDVLINNAAMNPVVGSNDALAQFAPYEDYSVDLWERELKVNLTGTMICTKLVAKQMIKQKSGSIINIASDVALVAHDHRVYNDLKNKKFKSIAYTTTKAALLGFTRQWAARLGQYGVRVNVFTPTGAEKANMVKDFVKRYSSSIMFGRMAKPDDYIGAIIFLSSDASRFMTGQNLVVDGGKTAW